MFENHVPDEVQTGAIVNVPQKRVPYFRASKVLVDAATKGAGPALRLRIRSIHHAL